MYKLVIMDVKTLNSVFIEYNKKARANTPKISVIKIQRFLAIHRYVQGKFIHGQAFMAAYILPVLSKTYQEYTASSSGIGAEDKDAKYAVTPVVFNSPDKFIPLLAYW